MSRPIVLTSCIIIIIALCNSSGGVMAFLPSKSSTSPTLSFRNNNLLPLHLKGSSSFKHAISAQQDIYHSTPSSSKSSLRLSASSNNNDQDNSTNKSNKRPTTKKRKMSISKQSLTSAQKSTSTPQLQQQHDDDDINNEEQRAYNELLPKTGYSLADSLEQSADNTELFETVLTPIGGVYSSSSGLWGDGEEDKEFEYDEDGFPIGVKMEEPVEDTDMSSSSSKEGENEEEEDGHDGIARIDTISNFGGMEPVRWIVSLGDNPKKVGTTTSSSSSSSSSSSHVMIDLPPYSDKLANEIRQFMNPNFNSTTTPTDNAKEQRGGGTLDAILLTNQQCIHYDNTPGVYVTRKSDLTKWKKAFPEAKVVMYRLDIPRECREEVTQVLDGYGPWGWKEEGNDDEGMTFVETGRPLTIEEWDEDTKSRVLQNGELPPDDEGMLDSEEDGETAAVVASDDDDDDKDSMYSQEAIRQREEQYRLLAVYTPGHTFGSVTYVFPKRNLCCSGFALPLESSSSVMDAIDDEDEEEDDGIGGSRSSGSLPSIGPRLDYQGYLATSASRPRQMSSALSLINRYIDRFCVVLPARGDIVFLDSSEEKRKRDLLESVGLYRKMSDIYGRLGIVE